MKIVVTGSLGHISKPLAEILVAQGHTVTVVSSKPEKQTAIAEMGTVAAIGSVDDAAFLADTFAAAGILRTDYQLHRPALGKVKLSDFVADFAAVYHQK